MTFARNRGESSKTPVHSLKHQYEKFPYPPIPRLALPGRGTGTELSFEFGNQFRGEPPRSHDGISILVAGCGTFEPVVVAQRHPRAKEIIALDLSSRALSHARTRLRFGRLTRRLGPVTFVEADLHAWNPDRLLTFDYILASNVLHHSPDPAALLLRLAGWLRPRGLMRIVTYPKASRHWMRETQRFFFENHLTAEMPKLRQACQKALSSLPRNHPVRQTFETHPEANSNTGIVDAFFHSLENPLPPLGWASACSQAGLRLLGEAQDESSSSHFFDVLVPEAMALHPWIKLQILDDLLELCANPILWLEKASEPPLALPTPLSSLAPEGLAWNLRRVEKILLPLGVSLELLHERLRLESGSRVSPKDRKTELKGLALSDYDWEKLLHSDR